MSKKLANLFLLLRELLKKRFKQLHLSNKKIITVESILFLNLSLVNETREIQNHGKELFSETLNICWSQSINDLCQTIVVLQASLFINFCCLLNIKGEDLYDFKHLGHIRCRGPHLDNLLDSFQDLVSNLEVLNCNSWLEKHVFKVFIACHHSDSTLIMNEYSLLHELEQCWYNRVLLSELPINQLHLAVLLTLIILLIFLCLLVFGPFNILRHIWLVLVLLLLV